jgi:hypothetical protein
MKAITLPDGIGHDACNQTIDELVQLVASQRALLESTLASLNAANETISTLNALWALMPTAKTEKRSRGRPKKRIDSHVLLETFNNVMLPEFEAANRRINASDTAVLTWYFTKELAPYGWSANRVSGRDFQSKLKTLKNQLGDARNRQYQTSH